jgi:hypothetical protein
VEQGKSGLRVANRVVSQVPSPRSFVNSFLNPMADSAMFK